MGKIIQQIESILFKYGTRIYEEYFSTWTSVQSPNPNRLLVIKLKLQLLSILSCIVIKLFLLFEQNSLSHKVNIILFNLVYIEFFEAHFNFWLAAGFTLFSYTFYAVYFDNFGLSTKLLYSVLIKQQDDFFLNSIITQKYFKWKFNLKVVKYLQFVAVLLCVNDYFLLFDCKNPLHTLFAI